MLRNDLIEKWYPVGLPKDDHGHAQVRLGQVSSDQSRSGKVSLGEIREDQSINLSDDMEVEIMRQKIKNQIGYNALKSNPCYKRIVEDIVNIIQSIYSEKSKIEKKNLQMK